MCYGNGAGTLSDNSSLHYESSKYVYIVKKKTKGHVKLKQQALKTYFASKSGPKFTYFEKKPTTVG